MLFFILFTAGLSGATIGLFAWVMLKNSRLSMRHGNPSKALHRLDAELELLRAQRQEFESDLQNHSVDAQYREQMLTELSQRAEGLLARRDVLVQASSRVSPRSLADATIASASMPHAWLHAGLALLMFMLAFGLYSVLGNPAALQVGPAPSVAIAKDKVDVAQLVARLEEKLNERPDQAEGWMLLGNTKAKLGDYAGAITADRKAIAIVDQRDDLKAMLPDLLSNLAEVLTLQNQGKRNDEGGSDTAGNTTGNTTGQAASEAQALIDHALRLDATHQKALVLGATFATRNGNVDQARRYWQRLAQSLPENSPELAEVNSVLAGLGEANRVNANLGDAMGDANAGKEKPARSEVVIKGSVYLSSALKAQLKAGDILFVFARRAVRADRPDSASPPAARMPLAVARFALTSASELAQWPRSFTLTDAMAMAPGAKLSDADQVEVLARVSHGGSALAASGDLSTAPVLVLTKNTTTSEPLHLLLDRTVP